ncbi:MAG TPA: hypothetical protein PK095_12230, partial [Myxococcota bacterium]|nr:hypothetical protein [Myxococcota bacterium]
MRPLTASLTALALATASVALAPPRAHALELGSGRVTLPLSGLVIELPALPANAGRYEVSSRYRLVEASSYSAIDTIHRRDAESRIVETFYVRHGKLKSDCRGFLAVELPGTIQAATAHGASGILAVSGTRGEAAFCSTPRTESVIVTLARPDRLLSEQQLADQLTRSPIAAAVIAAATARRFEVLAPLGRSDVTATANSRPYPAPIRLPKLAIDLTLPSDGFVWVHDAEASKDRIGDHLATIFPSATDLGITVAL